MTGVTTKSNWQSAIRSHCTCALFLFEEPSKGSYAAAPAVAQPSNVNTTSWLAAVLQLLVACI